MWGSASDRMRAISCGERVMMRFRLLSAQPFSRRGGNGKGRKTGSASLGEEPDDRGAQFGNAGAAAGRGREHLWIGGRMLGKRSLRCGKACVELGGRHLVGLGQHYLIIHRLLVERRQHVVVDRLEAVPRIDQKVDARQSGPPSEEGVD